MADSEDGQGRYKSFKNVLRKRKGVLKKKKIGHGTVVQKPA